MRKINTFFKLLLGTPFVTVLFLVINYFDIIISGTRKYGNFQYVTFYLFQICSVVIFINFAIIIYHFFFKRKLISNRWITIGMLFSVIFFIMLFFAPFEIITYVFD